MKMSKRERNLREFLVSTVAGAFVAAVLCAVLPEIERGLEMITFYLVFWVVGIMCVWTVIDLRDRYKDEHIGNICRDHIGRITHRTNVDDLGRGIR